MARFMAVGQINCAQTLEVGTPPGPTILLRAARFAGFALAQRASRMSSEALA